MVEDGFPEEPFIVEELYLHVSSMTSAENYFRANAAAVILVVEIYFEKVEDLPRNHVQILGVGFSF